MNLIKRTLTLLASLTIGISATTTVIACGPDNEFHILMVPNISETARSNFTTKIAPLIQQELADRGFNKKVVVTIAEDAGAAAQSVASGNAAVSFLPVFPYYQYSIKGKSNAIHGLFTTTSPAFNAEYSTATGTNKEEKVNQMNKNGSTVDMNQDKTNIYKLSLTSAKWNEFDQIISKNETALNATYYRSYQYISKITLKEYANKIKNDPSVSPELKAAWINIVSDDLNNPNYAIFDDSKTNDATEQNVQDYWQVVWSIYELASKDKGIGLSNDKASSAGRVNPIWTMMEAYLLAHKKDLNDPVAIEDAKTKVNELLNKKFKENTNYSVNIPHDLMHGNGKDSSKKDASTLSVGVGWGTARTHYSATDYSKEDVMDELMVLTTSHGIFNDGAVYSTRYFRNRGDLLQAVQDSFINLIRNNETAKAYFNNETYYSDFVPIGLNEAEMKEYEDTIADYYENPFLEKANVISQAIKPL